MEIYPRLFSISKLQDCNVKCMIDIIRSGVGDEDVLWARPLWP